MLVSIEKYIRDKLFYTKYGKIKTNEKSMRTIYDFIHKYNISNEGYIDIIDKGKIHLKKQIGVIQNIKLKDNKIYNYNVERYSSKNNKEHYICFVNMEEISHNCLCFTYSSKHTNLTLNDINSSEDCVQCNDKKHKFKIGDILMQIFLQFIKCNKKFSHVKTIELQDNSTKKCYGYGILLKYLRTITNGIPYYAKFGFRPLNNIDIKTFQYNRELYKKDITLETNDIIKIFDT